LKIAADKNVRAPAASLRLPPARGIKPSTARVQLAKSDSSARPGVVLDYLIVNGGIESYVFEGGQTYLLTGFECETAVIEGGAVLKIPSTGAGSLYADYLICQTAPYRMAIITSADENSFGEVISGSSGNPQPCTNLNSEALMVGSPTDLEYVRIAYQAWGFNCYDTITVRHCQFLHCSVAGVYSMGGGSLQNDLFSDCPRAWFDMTGSSSLDVENVTADNCATFLQGFSWSTNESLCLTNCLITGVTNLCRPIYGTTLPRIYTNSSVVTSDRAGYYQTAGGGSYYLCDASTNRSSGTTNVSSALLSDLRDCQEISVACFGK
jgi:hypothetical protein